MAPRSTGIVAGALLALAIAWNGPAFAQMDRLQGMVEPVAAKKPYRIAFASVDMNSDFWVGKAYGVFDESKLAKVELVRITSAGGYGKVAEQVAQLEQFATLNLDAVIIAGAAFDGYDKVVERLTEKGTKVIALGSPISAPKTSFGILQDETKIGTTLATFICERKPKGKVLTLPGPAGAEWNAKRFAAFKEVSEKCGETLYGNIFAGNIAIEDGQRQAGDQLVKYPDVDYIYAAAGILSVGAAQQAKRMNVKAPVVTGTFTRRTIDLLKDGSMAVVVSEPPIVLGRAAVQYAVRMLNGDPLPKAVNGIMPYPVAITPNVAVTTADMAKYDPSVYDLPPEGWTPPNLQ